MLTNVDGEPSLINPENVARFSRFGRSRRRRRALEVIFNDGRCVMECCKQKWDLSHYCDDVNSRFLFLTGSLE